MTKFVYFIPLSVAILKALDETFSFVVDIGLPLKITESGSLPVLPSYLPYLTGVGIYKSGLVFRGKIVFDRPSPT